MSKTKILRNTASYHDALIEALHDPREAFAYLQVALEEYQVDNNTEALLVALRNVAEAKGGMSKLAKTTHLNRQNLYKSLSKKGNPRLDTLGRIFGGLGFRLALQTAK